MEAVKTVVKGLVQFIQHHGNRKITEAHHPHNAKYKTSMCRDLTQRGGCPRGNDCTFAHSEDELEKYRSRSRKHNKTLASPLPSSAPSSTTPSKAQQQQQQQQNHHTPKGDHHHHHHHHHHHSQGHVPHLQSKNLAFNAQRLTSEQQQQKKQQQQQQASNSQQPLPQPTPILSLQPHPMHAPEMVRPMMKNGERAAVVPMMGKHVVVEEMVPRAPPALSPYEAPKFVQLPPHSSSLPVIAAGAAPTSVMRPALAPPPPPTPTPVFAPPIPDYAAYGAFHPTGPIFAQAGPGPGGPPTPAYSPQHPPPPLIPELYSPSPQAVLVNQPHVYNIISPAREFSTAQQPIAETRQTSAIAKSVVSSWAEAEASQAHIGNEKFIFTSSPGVHESIVTESSLCSVDILASKSYTELNERKEELLNKLENIVGKEAVDEVASQIENGDLMPETSSSMSPDFSSTYSIWTSGANLPSWSEKSPEKTWDPAKGYRTYLNQSKQERKDDFIPFDPPVVSRFGPISRMTRPFLRPTKPIQVSACSTTDPVTTPTVHRPVPAISPMPQVCLMLNYLPCFGFYLNLQVVSSGLMFKLSGK